MRNLSLLVALFYAIAVAPAPAQQGSTTVTIRVIDPTGAHVAHAQIRFMPSEVPAALETDDNGQCSVNLKAGGYDLSVSASGFKMQKRHLDIGAAAAEPGAAQIIPIVLQVGDVSSPIPIYPVDSLVITGDANHSSLALSPAQFRALPHVTITVHNGHTNAVEKYSGVALATLLAKVSAPLGDALRGDAMTSYVVATGSDGYAVALSLAEVDPSFHADQVIVADIRDGQPLGKTGPFQLIVSDDKRPARWVRNLDSITLHSGR
ncbi:MAG: carboxypeptidase regulatory-like domain-containing protein [Candidatus Sulfotelmatobacter sp.]